MQLTHLWLWAYECDGHWVQVVVDLTAEGVGHIGDITAALFQYLAMLKQQPWQEWIFNGTSPPLPTPHHTTSSSSWTVSTLLSMTIQRLRLIVHQFRYMCGADRVFVVRMQTVEGNGVSVSGQGLGGLVLLLIGWQSSQLSSTPHPLLAVHRSTLRPRHVLLQCMSH